MEYLTDLPNGDRLGRNLYRSARRRGVSAEMVKNLIQLYFPDKSSTRQLTFAEYDQIRRELLRLDAVPARQRPSTETKAQWKRRHKGIGAG